MAEILFTNANSWIYLLMSLVSFYFLWKLDTKFNPKEIVDSLIKLTNFVNLLLIFLTFLLMFIYTIIDFTDTRIITYFQDNVVALLYFSFICYSVFYALKLINYMIEFFKSNDLFGMSYFGKMENKLK